MQPCQHVIEQPHLVDVARAGDERHRVQGTDGYLAASRRIAPSSAWSYHFDFSGGVKPHQLVVSALVWPGSIRRASAPGKPWRTHLSVPFHVVRVRSHMAMK